MLLFEDYRKKLTESIRSLYPEVRDNDIAPDRTGHADLALRAFSLLRKGDVKIEDVASKITVALSGEDYIADITPSGGYINFTLSPSKLMEAISSSGFASTSLCILWYAFRRFSVVRFSFWPNFL